uniref:SWI/SNF complex subunit SWI3D n=1 Tax=Ananas comosus var. bracteatus TaxID=296719 RepID=A0A6V7NI26_ANACO|nr:unnamed protein product [Ananas comosus var. bracteatus]
MQKFHADPNVQMELKDFSELSVGDADAKQEVFEFLDHWGLINFHPFPPSGTNDSKSDGDNGDDKMSSIVDKLYQFDTVQSYINSAHKKAEPTMPAPPPSLISETALADALVITLEPSVEYHCNSCSADCSRKRYHCQTQADFDLCIDCFNERKFDPGMSPADFILMGPAEAPGASGANWTDQETLLLLEALELFGENWSEIAEHVATKTKVQCMLHFLQMPIEDSFLDGDDEINESIQEKAETTSADKELASTTVPEKMEVENQVEEKEKEEEEKKEKESEDEKESSDVKMSEKIEGENTGGKESDAINLPDNKDVENSGKADLPIKSDTDDTEKKNTDNISSESASDSAVDALKSAFQAVGFFSENGELGSFAEAGNPVMALAAFLVALVEHDNAITSCRSSLKAISEESPAIQLATRHCFILEDPPGDMKSKIASKGAECQKDEDQTLSLNGTDKLKDSKEQSEENALSLEKKMDPSALTKGELELPDEKVLGNEGPSSEAAVNNIRSSGDQKDATDANLPAVPPTNNTKESVVLDSQEAAESLEKKMNDLKSVGEEKPLNVKVGDLDSQDKGEIDTLKSKDTGAAPAANGEQESKQTSEPGSTLQKREEAGEGDKKEVASTDDKSANLDSSHGNYALIRLKRAAATALSAAAVNSKLLAKQEEEQIQQLVLSIIEKQFHKLESKLALFADLENIILRIREQTERTKQRLLHERSQIIAARLGLPAPSFRPNPTSVPPGRYPAGYGMPSTNSLNVVAQKPPAMRRP